MKPSVKIHIEELVLHGFARPDRYRIAEALQRELAQRFAQPGALESIARDGCFSTLDGGTIPINRDSDGHWIGARTAQAVHTSLSQAHLSRQNQGRIHESR